MVAVGLVGFVAIAFLSVWGVVAAAVLVAYASFGLIVERTNP